MRAHTTTIRRLLPSVIGCFLLLAIGQPAFGQVSDPARIRTSFSGIDFPDPSGVEAFGRVVYTIRVNSDKVSDLCIDRADITVQSIVTRDKQRWMVKYVASGTYVTDCREEDDQGHPCRHVDTARLSADHVVIQRPSSEAALTTLIVSKKLGVARFVLQPFAHGFWPDARYSHRGCNPCQREPDQFMDIHFLEGLVRIPAIGVGKTPISASLNAFENSGDTQMEGMVEAQFDGERSRGERSFELLDGSTLPALKASGQEIIPEMWPGTLTVSWDLGGPESVQADPGGPYPPIERGGTLTLNGSKSEGKIQEYKWTFAAEDCPSDISPDPKAEKKGKTTSVILLCSVKATLTVRGADGEDSKSVVLKVKPREWKTPFQHSSQEGTLSKGGRPVIMKGYDTTFDGAQNDCAPDPNAAEFHNLHPAAQGDSWNSQGYTLEQVHDPEGPFDQWWFVSEYKLRIDRQTMMNKYIVPGGPPPVTGAKTFYEANKELKTDVDGYLAAVRAHEGMQNASGVLGHSGRMKKALDANDPGKTLESLASKDSQEELKKKADEEIRKAEHAICQQSVDPLPLIWKGRIAFAHDDSGKYEILPSAIAVGGPGYGQIVKCK